MPFFLMGVLLSSNLFAERKLDAKPSQIKVSNFFIILVLLFLAYAVRFIYSDLLYLAAQSKQVPGDCLKPLNWLGI